MTSALQAAATAAVREEVGDAAGLLGLLLVLVILFTAEQSRRYDIEQDRKGEVSRWRLRFVAGISTLLALVTVAALIALWPLQWDAFDVWTSDFEAILFLFSMAWALLLLLAAWQIALVVWAIRDVSAA